MGYILYAEDDAGTLEIVQEMLEAQGYAIYATTNGTNALARALIDKPKVLLLDVMMPNISGLEIAQAVKEHYPHNPPKIILITALSGWENIKKGRLAGADDYIIKPFAPEVLSEKVRAAMEID